MNALLISLLSLIGWAAPGDSLPAPNTETILAMADSAYNSGEYQEAYDMWIMASEQMNGESASLEYNLGNAAWRMKELGESIYHWKKALRLNPDLEDAQANLELAQARIIDKIEAPEKSPLQRLFERFYNVLSPKNWAALSLVLIVMMMLAVLGYRKWNHPKSGLLLPTAVALFLLGAITTSAGIVHEAQLNGQRKAVVLDPNVYVKSAPMTGAADAFILHEGTDMDVVRTVNQWAEIRLADGKVGWIPLDELGIY